MKIGFVLLIVMTFAKLLGVENIEWWAVLVFPIYFVVFDVWSILGSVANILEYILEKQKKRSIQEKYAAALKSNLEIE